LKGFEMYDKIDLEEVKETIRSRPNAKIYFGCDSTKFKKNGEWHARFVVAVVVYEKDNNKIFGEISYERDFDKDPSRPALRMMNEVFKVSSIVLELQEVLEDRYFEIHLDINPNIMHGSSVALGQAIGYIKGVNGIDPVVKPDAWCASAVADHLLKHKRTRKKKKAKK
jgi:predicted RNase H-related nuclease YkuK (DUF458 family)